MKKQLLLFTVTIIVAFGTIGLKAQGQMTGEKYFEGIWTVQVEIAPEYSAMVYFYNNDENVFSGNISNYDGSITELDSIKVEGDILTGSTYSAEMGTINIRLEKKDENTATGEVMDGSSLITCTRYIPEN